VECFRVDRAGESRSRPEGPRKCALKVAVVAWDWKAKRNRGPREPLDLTVASLATPTLVGSAGRRRPPCSGKAIGGTEGPPHFRRKRGRVVSLSQGAAGRRAPRPTSIAYDPRNHRSPPRRGRDRAGDEKKGRDIRCAAAAASTAQIGSSACTRAAWARRWPGTGPPPVAQGRINIFNACPMGRAGGWK